MLSLSGRLSILWVNVRLSSKKWQTNACNVSGRPSRPRSRMLFRKLSSSFATSSGNIQTNMKDYSPISVRTSTTSTTPKPKPPSSGSSVSTSKSLTMRMNLWATLSKTSKISQMSSNNKFWPAAWNCICFGLKTGRRYWRICLSISPRSVKTRILGIEDLSTGDYCRPTRN